MPIIDETMRVLRIKFGWSDTDLHDALLVMESCTTKVTPTEAQMWCRMIPMMTGYWNAQRPRRLITS